MAFITADRVKDTSTTTGTGDITVSGSAPLGYRTFSTVLSVGDTFYYCVQSQASSEWEVGLGTYSSANVFARTTVLASSASGNAVSFSSGTKNVFITLPANKTLQFDATGSPTTGGILYGTGSMLAYSAAGTAGQALISGGTGAPTWATITGLGTVTSVNVNGGTTGLTASGGPVTTSGTITLAGTLAVANGGTGVTSPGTNGNVLTSNGTTWVSQAPSGTGTAISNGTSNVTIASSNGAITAATAGTTAMTISTSQNTTFAGSLTATSLTAPLYYGGTGAASTLTLQSTTGVGTTDSISFKVGNAGATTAMFINTSGSVGIGTTSPSTTFQVTGNSTLNGRVAFNGTLRNASYNGASQIFGDLNINTILEIIGTSTGTAGSLIGFTNNNSTSVGGISTNGTTTSYNTSSDYRLKENVVPMANGLAIISALKPVTYDWISDKSMGEGFIAHELQEIIPHAVTGEKNAVNENNSIKPQGVDYSKIVVYLVAAIQELTVRLAALEAK
jgi:hypothetical protein